MSKVVGQPVVRVDSLDKVTGVALYVADLRLPGMLYGRVLRSPRPHARIVSLNAEAARKLPGVVAVVTGRDLDVLGGKAVKDMPFLAREGVRYVGEPVAAVAAVEERVAEQALDLIQVEYEDLRAVFDPLAAAAEGAPLLHENQPYLGGGYGGKGGLKVEPIAVAWRGRSLAVRSRWCSPERRFSRSLWSGMPQ